MAGARLAVAAALLALAGCGGSGAVAVSLGTLARDPERYSDREVVAAGTVERGRRGSLELVAGDRRIALQAAPGAARLAGQRVSVQGTFVLDPVLGRAIRAQRVTARGG